MAESTIASAPCMANRGHSTNGAQFFITEEDKPEVPIVIKSVMISRVAKP